ncbi:glycosyltransferase [Candidatus Gracilibacteria bacterium]|nr:glycosyltransferase [Candidatus Gracilibacteria bacterium]
MFHRLTIALTLLYAADRLWKLACVERFFRHPPPPAPAAWPSITLIQPVTRAEHNLQHTLATRPNQQYPGHIQLLFVCDEADSASQQLCRTLMQDFPTSDWALITVEPDCGPIASKIAKLRAALPIASSELLCFIDDDILLRPDTLATFARYLADKRTGAVFGLACYTNWDTAASSLMSGFVNANALLSYIPLTFLTEPYTITGHLFALRRAVFAQIGGFDDMQGRLDDDHELARRVRAVGKRNVQTPLIYDVENVLPDLAAYRVQFKRWFIFPRQMMLPYLSQHEQLVSTVGSLGNILPSLVGALALISRSRQSFAALASCLGYFYAAYAWCETRHLKRRTPWQRWPLLAGVAIVTPLDILRALFANNLIEWRGVRMRIQRGGRFEVDVPPPKIPRRCALCGSNQVGVMHKPFLLIALFAFAERIVKALAVWRFFRQARPDSGARATVSILQPILSGDPALERCLETNLRARSGYRREFIWLLDDDDALGHQLCRQLIAQHPQEAIRLVELPAPPHDKNPKMVKLVAGAALAQGAIICVLDDDTILPDNGLEQCLPALDAAGVGVAFGLPYYISFDDPWSSLVATFVNSNSLLTYVPYTFIHEPLTLNGMFYALKRSVYEDVGGFTSLEHTLADDFAVAQHLRTHGYRLVQTPLRHAIRTTIKGPAHYWSLMQRWLIFPRESLLRHLPPQEQALLYVNSVLPVVLPWLLLLENSGFRIQNSEGAMRKNSGLRIQDSEAPLIVRLPRHSHLLIALGYFVFDYALVMGLNRHYLGAATPWRWSWLIPLLRLLLPVQLIVACSRHGEYAGAVTSSPLSAVGQCACCAAGTRTFEPQSAQRMRHFSNYTPQRHKDTKVGSLRVPLCLCGFNSPARRPLRLILRPYRRRTSGKNSVWPLVSCRSRSVTAGGTRPAG